MNKQQQADQQLNDLIAKLPKEMSPERDLWQGIEKAIQHKSAPANRRMPAAFSWAASVVVAILLTWQVTKESSPVAPSLAMQMQQEFSQQKQTLLVSYGQPDLSQLSVEIQQQFQQLNSAQQTIQQALADDPGNVDLLNLLRWTQQQELELIEQLYQPKWQAI